MDFLPHDLQEISTLSKIDVHSENLTELPELTKCHNL